MRTPCRFFLALLCIFAMHGLLWAAVRPWNGPPPLLSRMPVETNAGPGHLSLDEYDNFRINSDESGQVQNEEMVCVNPLNSNELVAVWRDFRYGYRRVGFGHSTDGGFTWQDNVFPQMYYPWQSDPVLVVDADGIFTAMVISFDSTGDPHPEDGLLSIRSTDGGQSWCDSSFFINNDPAAFEDKEMLTVDNTDSLYRGTFYCVWTRFFGYPDTDSTHIALVRRGPDGASPPLYISQTSSNQWANVAVGAEGEVYVSWVSYAYRALMFSSSMDGGRTFSREQPIVPTLFREAFINGEILIFSYGAMAVDQTDGPYRGRLYLVYTDMTPDSSETDVWLIHSDDAGENWSTRQRMDDGHETYPVDQFHPWITVDPVGRVWVVFYDRRNDPGNCLMDIYFTASTDGGQTWRPNDRVTTVSSAPRAGPGRAGLIGEYIGLCASANRAHVVWTDTRLGNQDAYGTVLDSIFSPTGPFVSMTMLPTVPTLAIFPNPTNSAAQLHYILPQSGKTELALYNILGEKVWSLPPSFASAGSHRVALDLTNLATGFYIAQLHSNGGVAKATLILAK